MTGRQDSGQWTVAGCAQLEEGDCLFGWTSGNILDVFEGQSFGKPRRPLSECEEPALV